MSNDMTEQVYIDLERLIWKMAYDAANSSVNWRLDPDELAGELFMELVTVCDHYPDKPLEELKSLAVVSLRNRISDIKSMVYDTHRSAEMDMLSTDYDYEQGDGSNVEFSFGKEDNYFNVADFIDTLPDDARRLVLEILWPSDRTRFYMNLFLVRRQAVNVSDRWQFTVMPLMMARALGWSQERLSDAWAEVEYAVDCL